MASGDEMKYSSGAVDSHASTMAVQVGRLRGNLQELERGDKQLEATWEGDMKADFMALQADFRTAFNEFNSAFDSFITTTRTNSEAAQATELANCSRSY